VAELDMLRARYPHEATARLAADLGLTAGQVHRAASRAGLRKTAAFMASPDACRMRRGDNVGAAYRFKPGLVPWNKGLKGYQPGGRSAQTRFRKGHVPPNRQDLGALRITSDGTLEIKLAPTGLRQWMPLAHYEWQRHTGRPVPRGWVLWHRNGDPFDADPANLELISRREVMRRNSIHRYPRELKRAIVALGQFNRRVKEHEQQHRGPARPPVRHVARPAQSR
jgi:hypothetical protein